MPVRAELALPCGGEAAEQQRKDDAGISARPAQQGRSGHIRRFGQGQVLRRFGKIGRGSAERHAHVRAGIAVGNGEHVQLVDLLAVVIDRRSRTADQPAEGSAVNGLNQVRTPPCCANGAR